MLPDMLDTFLPTPDTKALLLTLVKAHARTTAQNEALSGFDLRLNNEAIRANCVAAWLESVPTRSS